MWRIPWPTPATIARPGRSWSWSSTIGPTTTWRCTTRACPSTRSSNRSSPGSTSRHFSPTTTRMTAGRGTRGTCSRVFASRERPMVAEPPYLNPGVVLQDRYEIADEIGRGGFSIVYRARDRRIGADVAIKLLVPPPAAARLARERLRREVQAVRQLSHPNIVAVYDVVDDGPWSFVVMEYVPGPDLAVRVRQRGPLDPDAAARLGRDIPAALAAAHRRGAPRCPPGSMTSWGGPRCRIPTIGFPRSRSSRTPSSGALMGSKRERLRCPRTRRAACCAARRSRLVSGSVLAAPAALAAGTTCWFSSSGPRRDRRAARCARRWKSGSAPGPPPRAATPLPPANGPCSGFLPRRAPAPCPAPPRGGPPCRRRSWCSPASSR